MWLLELSDRSRFPMSMLLSTCGLKLKVMMSTDWQYVFAGWHLTARPNWAFASFRSIALVLPLCQFHDSLTQGQKNFASLLSWTQLQHQKVCAEVHKKLNAESAFCQIAIVLHPIGFRMFLFGFPPINTIRNFAFGFYKLWIFLI